MQRLRLRFSRGDEIKFISHLDIIRLWQRVMVRAGIPLAYSEGFNPHPRISLAAPMALGVTSQAELMDIFCSRWVSPHWFTDAVNQQLTPGLELLQANAIPPAYPSLQSQTRHAEYLVTVESPPDKETVASRISSLLATEHLPWEHQRDTGTRSYDLRFLIDDLWLANYQTDYATIGMRLRCDNLGSGRPEQVCLALDFRQYPRSIHRTRLILSAK